MRKLLLLWLVALTSNVVVAQFIKEKSITASIGYGITVPEHSYDDVASGGFFIQGEYILKVRSWLDLKPYAGFVITDSNGKDLNDNPSSEFAQTTAFLLGGKVRFKAPIPYVAPYIELGFGTSIGKFETFTAFSDINRSGIAYHIPYSIGLELGKNHDVDIGFSYFSQPGVEQVTGVINVGINFPLDSK